MTYLRENRFHKPIGICLLVFMIVTTNKAGEDLSTLNKPGDEAVSIQDSKPIENVENATSETPSTQPSIEQKEVSQNSWLELALLQEKPRDYLYRLLEDVTPTEFEQKIIESANAATPLDRTHALEEKFQKRISALKDMTRLSDEQRKHIFTELQQAKELLIDKDQAGHYALLGHAIYTFILNSQPFLLPELRNKPALTILRMLIFFLQSITAGKTADEAFTLTKNADFSNGEIEVSNPEKPLILALGKTLFQKLTAAHKQLLLALIESQPPANLSEPEDLYLQKIAKKYLDLAFTDLQNMLHEQEEKNHEEKISRPEQSKQPKTPTETGQEGKAPEEIPAPILDNKKVVSSLEKAIEKLQSALHSIRQLASSAKGSDRTAARNIVDKTLKANATLKTVADRISAKYKDGAPAQEFSTYVQTVQEIYNLANGL